VPIALVTNMIRIVATGWCYYLGWNRQAAHDWSGYFMMPIGLLLVLFELFILSWLVPVEPEEDQKPILVTDQALAAARQAHRTETKQRTSGKKKEQSLPEI
jgi:uncharacterized membrane protein